MHSIVFLGDTKFRLPYVGSNSWAGMTYEATFTVIFYYSAIQQQKKNSTCVGKTAPTALY
jgi:hypothetical protein